MKTTYENDVIAWAYEQAHLLRTGQFSCLDISHIAEEIEDVGKSEQRELASRMAVLLAHLLKWQFNLSIVISVGKQPVIPSVIALIVVSEKRLALRHRYLMMIGGMMLGMMPLPTLLKKRGWRSPFFQKTALGQWNKLCLRLFFLIHLLLKTPNEICLYSLSRT